jgi:hypothetical protein
MANEYQIQQIGAEVVLANASTPVVVSQIGVEVISANDLAPNLLHGMYVEVVRSIEEAPVVARRRRLMSFVP